MAVDAISKDYPVIQAYVMWILAIIYVLVKSESQTYHRFLDPQFDLGGVEQ